MMAHGFTLFIIMLDNRFDQFLMLASARHCLLEVGLGWLPVSNQVPSSRVLENTAHAAEAAFAVITGVAAVLGHDAFFRIFSCLAALSLALRDSVFDSTGDHGFRFFYARTVCHAVLGITLCAFGGLALVAFLLVFDMMAHGFTLFIIMLDNRFDQFLMLASARHAFWRLVWVAFQSPTRFPVAGSLRIP